MSYKILIKSGQPIKRHLDQIRLRETSQTVDAKETGESLIPINKQSLSVPVENNETLLNEEKSVEVIPCSTSDIAADEQNDDYVPSISTEQSSDTSGTPEATRRSARTRNAPDYFTAGR